MSFGKWKKESTEPNTYKDMPNFKTASDYLAYANGCQEAISKNDEEAETKLDHIAKKKILVLEGLGKEAAGKLVELEQERIYWLSRLHWTRETVKEISQKRNLETGYGTIRRSASIRNFAQTTEHGKQKCECTGEPAEQERAEDAWMRHQMATGKQETNGGMPMTTTTSSSSTTFMAGSPMTFCSELWTDTQLMSLPKGLFEDLQQEQL